MRGALILRISFSKKGGMSSISSRSVLCRHTSITWTPAERKDFAKVSMDTLWRMARGEIQGYNVMPALDVIRRQLRSPDNALQALEILGRLPGKEIQYQLAAIATDPAQDAKVRLPAAIRSADWRAAKRTRR